MTLLLTGGLRKVEMLEEGRMKNGVEWLKCRIGAGCYLGHNPMDKNSTLENSACYQMNAQGYAFLILGGISQQSVRGFHDDELCWGQLEARFC